MEEQLSPVAVTHLLQHTLRSLCTSGDSQWVYAVFWRILPRNYPPPKWDLPGVAYDRSRGNRRNWILAWEDGFCNFGAATSAAACGQEGAGGAYAVDCESGVQEVKQSLQPELFFKMSHDIYNYGEGLIGKVASDHSHKWVSKEPQEQQETSLISSWNNPADSQPRTWEAQFQSGIQTIALIAVREGVVQLGSMKKVAEDLSYVVTLRRKFGYLETIPGVLLPHPSSAGVFPDVAAAGGLWQGMMPPTDMYVDPYGATAAVAGGPAPVHIMPSMSSLEALLSKLPSVVPAPPQPPPPHPQGSMSMSMPGVAEPTVSAKEELEEDYDVHCGHDGMDVSMSMTMPSMSLPIVNGGESTSTSAAAAIPPMSSYFVDVGGKPGEAGF